MADPPRRAEERQQERHSLLFHRASRAWWIPKFDSDILEGQYWRSTFPQIRLRFQLALLYVFVVSMSWCVYFSAVVVDHWLALASCCIAVLVLSALAFYLTLTHVYQDYHFAVSCLMALSVCLVTLPAYLTCRSNGSGVAGVGQVSPAGLLALSMQVLLLIYTVIPLPLYMCLGISTLYSLAVEALSIGVAQCESAPASALVRTLLHLGVHLIGVHIFVMTQVRMRCTFLKVGQLLLVRRELELEKQLKEKMIHSVMPPKVADWLMHEGTHADDAADPPNTSSSADAHHQTPVLERPVAVVPAATAASVAAAADVHGGQWPKGAAAAAAAVPAPVKGGQVASGDLRSIFRPFNMHRMESVSILFADIVGFTRMSSNKTAEQLVGLLNDLFGRFDLLCGRHGCEKISTLGDCYYCVAGCPEPRADHARCCVDMGLSMIDAIGHFDDERCENVSMRVGVHTGTVLCGIVGTRRFKFDVWSNDVTLANQMESTGRPSQVHVTEKTHALLDPDVYLIEEGDDYQGLRTYFVSGRKSDQESTTETTVWLDETLPSMSVTLVGGGATAVTFAAASSTSGASSSKKKANSMPSILDDMAAADSGSSHSGGGGGSSSSSSSDISNCRDKPLRMTRSVSQERKKRLYRTQRSQQDELSPLSAAGPCSTELRSSNAIVCPAGLNGRTDELSLFPSVESFIRAQGASTSNTLQRRHASTTARHGSVCDQAGVDIMTERTPTFASVTSELDLELDNCGAGAAAGGGGATAVLHASLSRFHQLRKQSDLQMIRCIQEDESHRVYFMRPPLSQMTLYFIDDAMEAEYRARAHQPDRAGTPLTLASPTYNTYLDIVVSAVIFVLISLACFVHFEPSWAWSVVFAWGTLILLAASTVFLHSLCRAQAGTLHASTPQHRRNLFDVIHSWCSRWYSWHACGALLMTLPVMAALSNFSCRAIDERHESSRVFWYLLFISLVHFCNFTQLNCWMKNALAAASALLVVLLVATPLCPCQLAGNVEGNTTTTRSEWHGLVDDNGHPVDYDQTELALCYEIILHLMLLLLLVCFLNREFEISFRLSFHCNTVAARGKAKVQSLKDQADWLLHNIIPRHVVEQMKTRSGYSENHRQAGILFASLVNFNEMYDESYLGGREYLRVLNELIGDFDELLGQPHLKNVDKIKTIGSTFMAASGLNSEVRALNAHPRQHLCELIDFGLAMQRVLHNFNQDLLEFDLILRVGFNCGDVTAGVIGTTKLYYDIWGDAVNIASRMDSTGVEGRIQTTEQCVDLLRDLYTFEKRGTVYVKGKDHMNVYLLCADHNNPPSSSSTSSPSSSSTSSPSSSSS